MVNVNITGKQKINKFMRKLLELFSTWTPMYPKLKNNGLELESEFKQKVKYFENLPLLDNYKSQR